MLLSVAGASSTLLEGRVPYAKRAFDGFVLPGSSPRYAGHVDRYVSAEGAVRLAAAAMDRCAHLALAETAAAAPLSPLLPSGAAITSAVSTLVARRGENSSFAAALTGTRCHVLGVRFAREAGRERAEEEELCGRLLVSASALAQEMPGDGIEGLFAALAPLKYLRLPADGGEQPSPAAGASSKDGAPARRMSAGDTAGVAAPAISSSSIDHRVPVSLPLDTIVHAEVPLPDPLDRLLGQGADAFSGAAAAVASTSASDAHAAASASPASAPVSLRAAVLQWLPSVTHVLFSASHAAAPSAGAPAAPRGAPNSGLALQQLPVGRQQQIGNAALNNPPSHDSAAPSCCGGAPPARPLPTLLLVPGSFNPVHEGHTRMADAARSTLQRLWRERAAAADGGVHAADSGSGSGSGSPGGSTDAPVPIRVVFELSATNADKPPLARAEVLRRVTQFAPAATADAPTAASPSPFSPAAPSGAAPTTQPALPLAASAPVTCGTCEIVVTNAPRFVDKGRLFPGAAFVLGYDTAVRLIDPKYYGGSEDAMVEALLALKLQGTLILVAGRLVAPPAAPAPAAPPAAAAATGLPTTAAPAPHFMTLADIRPRIPSLLQGLFVELTEADFRADVSSTELRARAAAPRH